MATVTGMYSWSISKRVRKHQIAQITVHNRGPKEATLHLLPQLWFRDTWSWAERDGKPSLVAEVDGSITASDAALGVYHLYVEANHELLFCDNQTT